MSTRKFSQLLFSISCYAIHTIAALLSAAALMETLPLLKSKAIEPLMRIIGDVAVNFPGVLATCDQIVCRSIEEPFCFLRHSSTLRIACSMRLLTNLSGLAQEAQQVSRWNSGLHEPVQIPFRRTFSSGWRPKISPDCVINVCSHV